jgi:hypothetical protein
MCARRLLSATTMLVAVCILVALPSGASAVTGTRPWVVVLCNFSDDTSTPQTVGYYQQMFTGAPNGDGLFEYWRDVSYGNLSIAGTVVKGWYTLSMTKYQYSGLTRYNKIKACAQAADADVNYASYWGVFVMTNYPVDGIPAPPATTTTGAMTSGQTTMTVASAAGFPAPPFAVTVDDGSGTPGSNLEEMNVTAVSSTTWTVTRGYENFTPAKAHNSGAPVTLVNGPDYGSVGIQPFPMDGGVTLGTTVGGYTYNVAGAAHEMGHGFGYGHSRKLSTSTTDYNDCWDIMSVFSCVYTFTGSFGGPNLGSGNAAAGDGLTAINLDLQGWLAAPRLFTLDNTACNQTTLTMPGLNYPGLSGPLAARIPAAVPIPLPTPPGGTTTSSHYWIEHRDKSAWDRGIPANAVIVHLRGGDNVAYWVDNAGGPDGALQAGEEFVDAARNTYVAVNSIDAGTHLARVTLSGCKITPALTYVGDTVGDFSDVATLAADLTVGGAPVPGKSVSFMLGSQSCSGTTNAAGRASCTVTLNQTPGAYTVNASFAGNTAYNGATATSPFTIDKEDTVAAYTGPPEGDYHDPVTVSGTLRDADSLAPLAGKLLGFEIGVGDTCSATTDGSGAASCVITPNQVPGPYTVVTSFGGDAFYKPSSASSPFQITKEETITTYTGPLVIAQSQPVTLSGRLVEDDGTTPVQGRTLTLSVGPDSCTGVTNASGVAQCTIPSVTAALGPQPLVASFAGDAFYLPSSDTSKEAIVFAFLDRGSFVLGDATVAAATPATVVTWWAQDWPDVNALTGAAAPASFKGFAGTFTTAPPSCGSTWTTQPGNSTPPVDEIPSYMGTVVTSSVSKSGSTISGVVVKIVVVKTDPGYASNPGHHGTGTIVATYCS